MESTESRARENTDLSEKKGALCGAGRSDSYPHRGYPEQWTDESVKDGETKKSRG